MFSNKFTKRDPVAEEIAKIIEEKTPKHPDEKEDIAMVKKMVKSDCLKNESWDDDEDDDVRRADAELKRMKAKPIEADKKTDPDKEIGKLAKKTPKEVDESVEQIDEISRDLATRYIHKTKPEFSSPAENKKREAGRSMALKKVWGDKKYGLPEPKVKATEETVVEDKWTDIADGPWKKSNRSKSSAASAAANAAGKGLKGAQHKLDVAEPKGKLTGADFKKLRKEDAEQLDELSKKTLANYMRANTKRMADPKNPDSMERKMKRHDDYFKAADKFHKEEVELDEKTLTPAESKKKEEIVKSMKKRASGFKERYGKRAKEVMYATATKQAKKVAEEVSLYEGTGTHITLHKVGDGEFDVHHKGQSIGSVWSHRGGNRWAYHHGASGSSQAGFSKLKHAIEGLRSQHADHKVTMRSEETVSEAQGPTSTYDSDTTFAQNANTSSNPTPLSRVKDLARTAMSRLKNEMLGKAGTTSEEIDTSIKSTDTLKGRIAGGKKDDVGPGADGKSTKVKFTPGPK